MAALTYANLVLQSDKLAAIALCIKPADTVTPSNSTVGIGDSSVAHGAGTDYGARYKANQLLTLSVGVADFDYQNACNASARALSNGLSWQSYLNRQMQQHISNLNSYAGAAGLSGVTGINSFGTYYNSGAGGPWNCLFAPDFADVYDALFPASPLSPLNVYSHAIANMGQLTVTGSGAGTFAGGTGVNTAKYAGVGAAQLTVTSFAGSTGTVTVTGTNQAGVTGRTWTVSVTANGTYALVPTVASDLLVSVQGISIPASTLLASTLIVVNGLIPAGRTDPPT